MKLSVCCCVGLLSLIISRHSRSVVLDSSAVHSYPCTLMLHVSTGTVPSADNYNEHMIRLTNKTIEEQRRTFRRVNQIFKKENHPRNVNLAIVSYASTDIWDYASYSFAVNAIYANHNQYYIVLYDEEVTHGNHTHNYEALDSRWNKVKILERSIDSSLSDMDYVVWVDADFIFLDFDLRLEQIAAENPKAHIIMSAEHAGSTTLVNSGCIIVKNSKWSRNFLNEWWQLADRLLYSDQEQFDLLFEKRRREAIRTGGEQLFLEKIAILSPHRLNSDPPAMTKQRPDHQCLHLMGEHTSYRKKVFSSALQVLCERCGSSEALPPQLNLTQHNLLTWALQEYSEESGRFFIAFEENESKLHGVETCRKFANAVHHYAHALAHNAHVRSDDYRRSVRLRKQLYYLLHRNIISWKAQLLHDHQSSRRASIRQEWPELLKVTATAGQHIMNADSSVDDIIDIDDKRRAADETLQLLEEMLQISHPGQRDAVMLMVADVHHQIAILFLQEDSNRLLDSAAIELHRDGLSSSEQSVDDLLISALEHARTSLDITNAIAERSGQHLLVAPLSIAATCFSATKQYGKATALYEKALHLIEGMLNPSHETVAPVLVNLGISLYESGNCGKSLEVLTRATDIARSLNIPQQSTIYKKIVHYSNMATLCELKT